MTEKPIDGIRRSDVGIDNAYLSISYNSGPKKITENSAQFSDGSIEIGVQRVR